MAAASSTHPAQALEPQAGYNADPPCIRRKKRAVRRQEESYFASLPASFLLRLCPALLSRGWLLLIRRCLRHFDLLALFERV